MSLQKNSPQLYRQSSVIPFRIVHGKLEVLLITARGGNRWIVPKGLIDDGMSAVEAAAQEAYEEAGIRGPVSANSVGEYEYEKWGGTCHVQVFLMHVKETLDNWPESSIRKRRWVSHKTALEMVSEPALKTIIADLPQLVERNFPASSQ